MSLNQGVRREHIDDLCSANRGVTSGLTGTRSFLIKSRKPAGDRLGVLRDFPLTAGVRGDFVEAAIRDVFVRLAMTGTLQIAPSPASVLLMISPYEHAPETAATDGFFELSVSATTGEIQSPSSISSHGLRRRVSLVRC